MSKAVTVLGTYHEVQGAVQFPRNAIDPLYSLLLKDLISEVDFVFEEMRGLGPTTAERLVGKILGPSRYWDVDPPTNQHHEFGIPVETNEPHMVGDPMVGDPPNVRYANWQPLNVHEAREKLWLQRILGTEFEKGLMICGLSHMLSFAFRLRAADFQVKALDYLPRVHEMPAGIETV